MKKSILFFLLGCIPLFRTYAKINQETCVGNISLSSQAEVEAFSCTQVNGNLTISGADIADLSPLQELTLVSGRLMVSNCPQLTGLQGLENLVETDELHLVRLPALQNVIGLSGLVRANAIEVNSLGITDFTGMGPISHLEAFSVDACINLRSMRGMDSLKTLGNRLEVLRNFRLQTLAGLEQLRSVGTVGPLRNGFISINDNAVLANIDALDNLTYPGASVSIQFNPNLSTCCFITKYAHLTFGISAFIFDNGPGCFDFFDIADNCSIATCSTTTLRSQEEVDNFGCEIVLGRLTVSGKDIQNVNGLSQVKGAQGLFIVNNPMLENVDGFDNFNGVRNTLMIADNPKLKDLDGFVALNNMLANAFIRNNDSLVSIKGLAGIGGYGGDIEIDNCPELQSLEGLEGAFRLRNVVINNNDKLTSLKGLDNLDRARGLFTITNNDSLTTLSGVDQLLGIGEALIQDNANLANLDGLNRVKQAKHLEIVRNPALTNIKGLQSLNIAEVLIIEDNDALTALEGLENLDFEQEVSPEISIFDNGQLSSCCAMLPFVAGMSNAAVGIFNNAPGCSSAEEIIDACEVDNKGVIANLVPNALYTESVFSIDVPQPYQEALYRVSSYMGNTIATGVFHDSETTFSRQDFVPGVYIVQVFIDGELSTSYRMVVR